MTFPDSAATPFTLERPRNAALDFEGWLLASASSRRPPTPERADRWTEVNLYRTITERWVVETHGRSNEPGETTRTRVTVCETAQEVYEALRHPSSLRVPGVFFDALRDAADLDPDLSDALVQRI